jgi:hypothetical protein
MQGKDLAAVDSSSLVQKHVLRNDRRVANLEIVLRFSPCRSQQAFAWRTRSARKAGASDRQADTASPAAGQARVSSATTAEWAAPYVQPRPPCQWPERSGPHAALLSPEFWLHQPLAPAVFVIGGSIPFGDRGYFTPVPPHLLGYLPAPPPGYVIGYFDGYCVVYDPVTFTILSFVDLLD